MSNEKDSKNITEVINEEDNFNTDNVPSAAEEKLSEQQEKEYMSALAQAYAKALVAKGLKPGDPTFVEEESELQNDYDEIPNGAEHEIIELIEEEAAKEESEASEAIEVQNESATKAQTDSEEVTQEETPKKKRRRRKALKIKRKPYEKSSKGVKFLSKGIDIQDAVQRKLDDVATGMGKDFLIATHNISSSYKNTRLSIGIGLLTITVIVSVLLIIFDRFTVYEYAYNGKVLGYVKEQEEVTDVLDIAGHKLTENSGSSLDVKFEPNRNITFNLVDSGGKDLDTSDSAVNKLVYMTDIETEAYGVYDGSELMAIVKDSNDAEQLLIDTQDELSTPDRGMSLVSSEFANALDIKPLNVLLISVQDNTSAREQMVSGGEMQIYHILEEGEDLNSLSEAFSVSSENIFDETNSEIAVDPEQGDKVCIHKTVEPLSVTMVEKGRLKEVVEYKTVKKESDEFYKGDTFIEQEGEDGIQIFEGTITKEKGEIVSREADRIETVRDVQDKIIIVGTAERPKTAATGTFAMPVQTYVLTSGFGPRWGRHHDGLDMASRIGTPIYASDGGTVITAGYQGAYGLCIDIDHGNGYVTKYGHCSQLLVNVGEKVYQGQNIALMGSTGRSTGSHLHFEIIQNGTRIDPEPKLGLL